MTVVISPYNMVICGHDDQKRHYRGRIEKVKFGVPVAEAFSHDIPATLLVLLLKVNKEGPLKKDIWRAPGNQAQVRKLIQVMQHGRLVNIANFSVYTAASVIKKFLVKLPGGIFGTANEDRLFSIFDIEDGEKRRDAFCRVMSSLPVPSQHLLVLLFGTFRLVADTSDSAGTRMSPEAIGVSVAPSLFLTCIHDGHRAKLEDVVRYRQASQVVSWVIGSFGCTNLFPRDAYEFYARITGRTLRVDENWTFTFHTPSSDVYLQRQWLKAEACKLGCYNLTGAFSEPEVTVDRPSPILSVTPQLCHAKHPHTMPRGYTGRLGGSVGEVLLSYENAYPPSPPTGSVDQLKFLSPVLPTKNGANCRSAYDAANSSSQSIDTALHQRGVQRKRSWRSHYVRRKGDTDNLDGSHNSDTNANADAWLHLTVATIERPHVSITPSPTLPFLEESPAPSRTNSTKDKAGGPQSVVYHL